MPPPPFRRRHVHGQLHLHHRRRLCECCASPNFHICHLIDRGGFPAPAHVLLSVMKAGGKGCASPGGVVSPAAPPPLPSHPPAPQAALTAANVAVASSDVCKGKVCCGDGIARVVEWGVVLYGGRCIRACGGARDVMLVASLLLFLSLLFSSSFCRRTRVLLPSPFKPTSPLTH